MNFCCNKNSVCVSCFFVVSHSSLQNSTSHTLKYLICEFLLGQLRRGVWYFQHRCSDAAAAQGLCFSGAVALAAAQRAATAQQRHLQQRRGKRRQRRSGKKIAAAAQRQAARGGRQQRRSDAAAA